MMMPYTSLHLSLHDINLIYLDPSLLISPLKGGQNQTKVNELPEVQKSLVRVSGDLHPGDHVLLSLSLEVKLRVDQFYIIIN